MHKEIEISKRITVSVPSVPNYIKVDGVLLPISDFNEQELRLIGAGWTEALVVLAKLRARDNANNGKTA